MYPSEPFNTAAADSHMATECLNVASKAEKLNFPLQVILIGFN